MSWSFLIMLYWKPMLQIDDKFKYEEYNKVPCSVAEFYHIESKASGNDDMALW